MQDVLSRRLGQEEDWFSQVPHTLKSVRVQCGDGDGSEGTWTQQRPLRRLCSCAAPRPDIPRSAPADIALTKIWTAAGSEGQRVGTGDSRWERAVRNEVGSGRSEEDTCALDT